MKKQLVNPTKPQIKSFVKVSAEEMHNNANSEIVVFEASCKFNETGNLYFFIMYKNKSPN